MVSNIPSDGTGNARSCAEHAVLLTLATLRDLPGCCLAIQERRLGEPCGETLFGKQVLVLGYGNIARELIPLLHAFGASVTCVRRSPWQQDDQVCAGARQRRPLATAALISASVVLSIGLFCMSVLTCAHPCKP